jgi:phosphohistidine phosphatase
MKTLTLVRHAKSSWKEMTLSDRLRPLNKRGKADAPEMGERLARRGVKVDRMISSPAKRALKTARIMAEKLGYPREEIVEDERVYPGNPRALLSVIRSLDTKLKHVMLFGHNPGLTELANMLGAEDIDNVPTCGTVEMRFNINGWKEVGRVKGAKIFFDYPKKHRGDQ